MSNSGRWTPIYIIALLGRLEGLLNNAGEPTLLTDEFHLLVSARVSLKTDEPASFCLRLDTFVEKCRVDGSNRTLGQASLFMGRGRAYTSLFGP